MADPRIDRRIQVIDDLRQLAKRVGALHLLLASGIVAQNRERPEAPGIAAYPDLQNFHLIFFRISYWLAFQALPQALG